MIRYVTSDGEHHAGERQPVHVGDAGARPEVAERREGLADAAAEGGDLLDDLHDHDGDDPGADREVAAAESRKARNEMGYEMRPATTTARGTAMNGSIPIVSAM